MTFQSVFDPKKITKTTMPRMPDGPPLKEPKFDKGKEYEVAPANGVRPVPKFSRRAQIAGLLANAENVQFKRTVANRLWALMMGRGLIHPLDLDHSENPPSHPDLLTLLADEFALAQVRHAFPDPRTGPEQDLSALQRIAGGGQEACRPIGSRRLISSRCPRSNWPWR